MDINEFINSLEEEEPILRGRRHWTTILKEKNPEVSELVEELISKFISKDPTLRQKVKGVTHLGRVIHNLLKDNGMNVAVTTIRAYVTELHNEQEKKQC